MLILLLSVVLQITSSIIYSQNIIKFNHLTTNYHQQITQLKEQQQQLRIQWASLNTLENINQYANQQHLIPIKQSIKLDQ